MSFTPSLFIFSYVRLGCGAPPVNIQSIGLPSASAAESPCCDILAASISAKAGTRNRKLALNRSTASYIRRKSGHTPSATPRTSMRYVVAIPKMWWSGRSMSDLSDGDIGRTDAAHSQNVSIPRIVSSAPRGSDVVPLVNTMADVRSTSTESHDHIVLRPSSMAFLLALRKKSVLREPKLPVIRPGILAATSCDLTENSDECTSTRAFTDLSRCAISSALRFTSTGTATAPENRHAACTTIHSYEFSPSIPIAPCFTFASIMKAITAMSSVNCRHDIGRYLSPLATRNAGDSGRSSRARLNSLNRSILFI